MSRTIAVEILGDSKDLERAFARSSRAAKDFNRDVTANTGRTQVAFTNVGRSAAKMAGGFLAVESAAHLLAAGLKTSVEAASNLNEQTSKSRVVFGQASNDVEDWAQTLASSFGIAEDQALEAAGTFGNLFRTVGLGGRTAADMSQTLVELSADLAAFSNTDPDDALLALRSGLIGEAEPLRRYGVLLSETRVQQEAMAATGKRNAKSLTDQEKALARYRIILKDTTTAQGNFHDTQDGLAQQSKILRAEIRNLSANVGNLLIPTLTRGVSAMNDVIADAKTLGGALRTLAENLPLPDIFEGDPSGPFKRALGALLPVLGPLGDIKDALHDGADAWRHFREEAQQPLAVDFSAVSALTSGLMPAGLSAKDTIESRGLGQPTPIVFTAEQRREFFDARIGRMQERVQDVATLQGQVDALRKIAGLIEARMKATKDVTRRLALEDELLRVQRDIRSTQAELAAKAEQAEQDALDHQKEMARLAKERADAARERLETAQFRALGFGPGGDDLAPGVDALRRRLSRVTKDVQGTAVGASQKTRSALRSIRRLLSGELGELGDDVREKIESILAGIDRQLDSHASKRRARFKLVDTDDVLAGLGLSREQIRALSGRIGQIGKGGSVPLGGASAFGVSLGKGGAVYNVSGPITVKSDNPDVLARELQKRARRQAVQTRGVRPGTRQGIDG